MKYTDELDYIRLSIHTLFTRSVILGLGTLHSAAGLYTYESVSSGIHHNKGKEPIREPRWTGQR